MPPSLKVEHQDRNTRLDQWLSRSVPGHSRARWQQLIREGRVRVNGQEAKPNLTLRDGDTVDYTIPAPEPVELTPEDIPLDICFEDQSLVVLNKPAGLVVHPAPGHPTGTLVHALLHHCSDLQGIGGEIRPGIVHRLDRDTSGIMVVAKNETALNALQAAFKARKVAKIYTALAWGVPAKRQFTIDTLVIRNPNNRKKMMVSEKDGRRAVSHITTVESFTAASLLSVKIDTGRTHQIRVHLSWAGHPLVGDTVYGKARPECLPAPAPRQMLHARSLSFPHPVSGEMLTFEAPVPPDMDQLIQAFRNRAKDGRV